MEENRRASPVTERAGKSWLWPVRGAPRGIGGRKLPGRVRNGMCCSRRCVRNSNPIPMARKKKQPCIASIAIGDCAAGSWRESTTDVCRTPFLFGVQLFGGGFFAGRSHRGGGSAGNVRDRSA